MCQGSKTEQRKWWLYNRFRYIDSKYQTGTALQNTIVFRVNKNNHGNYSVLNITPYADIYANVYFNEVGDSKRAKRNETTTLEIHGIEDPNDVVARIYSADQLIDIGDISGLMTNQVNVTQAINLQSLKVGDAASDYRNESLTSLELGNNKLLKTIDARNCVSLASTINASQCLSLKEAYFDNTRIAAILLPNGGSTEVLHLPATITRLELRNLTKLRELQIASYDNLQAVWLENPSQALTDLVFILVSSLKPGSRIRANGIEFKVNSEEEITQFFESLKNLKGLDANGQPTEDKAQMSGIIHIDTMTYENKLKYEELYPSFKIQANHLICNIKFYSEDGNILLDEQNVDYGTAVTYAGAAQTKAETAQYYFHFNGWSVEANSDGENTYDGLNYITQSIVLYASFARELRYYTIQFIDMSYNPASILQTSTLPYGDVPAYTGETPIYNPDAPDKEDWGQFMGWNTEIVPVTGNATYIAKYAYIASITRKFITRSITSIDDSVITSIGVNAFTSSKQLTYVSFPNAVNAGHDAFFNCTSLTTVLMPSLTDASYSLFYSCNSLNTIDLRALTTVPYTCFFRCSSLTEVDLPNVTVIDSSAFAECTRLEVARFDKVERINSQAFESCTMLKDLYLGTECLLDNANAIPKTIENIYVPAELVEKYQTATNWIEFADKIKAEETK